MVANLGDDPWHELRWSLLSNLCLLFSCVRLGWIYGIEKGWCDRLCSFWCEVIEIGCGLPVFTLIADYIHPSGCWYFWRWRTREEEVNELAQWDTSVTKQCSALQPRIRLDILLPSNSRGGTNWIVCFSFVSFPGSFASLFLDCSCLRLLHTAGGSWSSYIDTFGARDVVCVWNKDVQKGNIQWVTHKKKLGYD